ncbi:protein disulfide-isomerase-like [Lactuca sativa]|uniref:protein disulfide-isomerase-like n=1 Tax=Lactuca sativa TaxID=4236 RepID=UPI000CD85C60|nr:protein disulfide-isomerase-like [Lactuca sativa]
MDISTNVVASQNQVGIFPKFLGEEYDNFMILAEKLRSDYDFGHITNSELIPHGESSITKPSLRLLKPFDELFVDSKEFKVDAMEKFIEAASTPLVTLFDQSPEYIVFLSKYFEREEAKVMFLVDYTHDEIGNFKKICHEVAGLYKGKGLYFLIGNVPDSQGVFQYFGVKEDQSPVLILQDTKDVNYVKLNVEVSQIVPWLMDYTEGIR